MLHGTTLTIRYLDKHRTQPSQHPWHNNTHVNARLVCESKCDQKSYEKKSSFKRSTYFDVLPTRCAPPKNSYRTKRTPNKTMCRHSLRKFYPSIAATAVNIDIASMFAHNKAVKTVFLFVDPSYQQTALNPSWSSGFAEMKVCWGQSPRERWIHTSNYAAAKSISFPCV